MSKKLSMLATAGWMTVGDQMALGAVFALLRRLSANPKSARAKAIRSVLVDLLGMVDLAVKKIPA